MIFRFEVLDASLTGHMLLFRLLLNPARSLQVIHLTLQLAIHLLHTRASHSTYKLINPESHSLLKLLFALEFTCQIFAGSMNSQIYHLLPECIT